MPSSLLDSLQEYVTPQLVSRASSLLGESEGNTVKAMGAVLPTILGGLLNKTSETGAAHQLFDLMSSKESDGSALGGLDAFLGTSPLSAGLGGLASQFLASVFGDKLGTVTKLIGSFSGIKESSASTLIHLGAPLIMSVLGKKITAEVLTVQGLLHFLGNEKESILKAAPAGLAGALGIGNLSSMGISPLSASPIPTETPGEKLTGSNKILWPALVIIAAAVLLWLLLRDCGGHQPGVAVDTTKAVATRTVKQTGEKAAEGISALGNFMKRTLGTGVELNIPELGIEKKVIDFLEDASRQVDKNTWFNFDRLTFETGSATLKPASQEQLHNIAEILKAFPRVKIKIGGYTDNVGNPEANMKLSQSRADKVMKELVVLGVEAERMKAEGYGDQYPVGDNATDEGRAMNRRIALRVTEK